MSIIENMKRSSSLSGSNKLLVYVFQCSSISHFFIFSRYLYDQTHIENDKYLLDTKVITSHTDYKC